jgi:hypothetical protein
MASSSFVAIFLIPPAPRHVTFGAGLGDYVRTSTLVESLQCRHSVCIFSNEELYDDCPLAVLYSFRSVLLARMLYTCIRYDLLVSGPEFGSHHLLLSCRFQWYCVRNLLNMIVLYSIGITYALTSPNLVAQPLLCVRRSSRS